MEKKFLFSSSLLSYRVHDQRPQLLAARHGRDVEAVVVSLVDVLLDARVGHVVVVALSVGKREEFLIFLSFFSRSLSSLSRVRFFLLSLSLSHCLSLLTCFIGLCAL